MPYPPFAAWVAVIVVTPTPTTVNILPTTVPTNKSEDVYVNEPELLEDGSVNEKDTSVVDFIRFDTFVIVGVTNAHMLGSLFPLEI